MAQARKGHATIKKEISGQVWGIRNLANQLFPMPLPIELACPRAAVLRSGSAQMEWRDKQPSDNKEARRRDNY